MNEKYQLVVIGSGSGGSEAAFLAAKKGYKVAVIENGALGGTRLHHGSYAVRALHASARLHGEFFKGKKFGIDADLFTDSLMQWMKAQRAASNRLARDLQKDLEKLNVRVALGRGTLVDEHRVQITTENGKQEEIEADYIILATGARPDYIGSAYDQQRRPSGQDSSSCPSFHCWWRLCRLRVCSDLPRIRLSGYAS
jgi:pyruvate/2-oxoglutarate dehydrogenase complex dihydrolipoamide dehydrogenase (E3) component